MISSKTRLPVLFYGISYYQEFVERFTRGLRVDLHELWLMKFEELKFLLNFISTCMSACKRTNGKTKQNKNLFIFYFFSFFLFHFILSFSYLSHFISIYLSIYLSLLISIYFNLLISMYFNSFISIFVYSYLYVFQSVHIYLTMIQYGGQNGCKFISCKISQMKAKIKILNVGFSNFERMFLCIFL